MRCDRGVDAAAERNDKGRKADDDRAQFLPERELQAAPDHDWRAVPQKPAVIPDGKPGQIIAGTSR